MNNKFEHHNTRVTDHIPLCVDLDGTLVKNDLLFTSMVLLFKRSLVSLFVFPFWVLLGRARLKDIIANRIAVDPSTLRFNTEILAYLHNEKNKGRTILLVSGSHISIAKSVADYLQIFSEVIASNKNVNLTGTTKAKVLVKKFGEGHFDYIGNSYVDIPVWLKSRKALIVSNSVRLIRRLQKVKPVEVIFASH